MEKNKKLLNKFFIFLSLSLLTTKVFLAMESECSDWGQMEPKNLAVIKVPVAIAILRPIGLMSNPTLIDIYKNCLLNFDTSTSTSCKRGYKLLFNEVVRVRKKRGEEYKCELSNAIYYNNFTNEVSNCAVWTRKENLTYLRDLKQKNVPFTKIIPPAYCDYFKNVLPLDGCVVLIVPWYDCVTDNTYSLGTRFVRNEKFDKKHSYAINVLFNDLITLSYVPKELAFCEYPNTFEEAIHRFVTILYFWSNLESSVCLRDVNSCNQLCKTDSNELISYQKEANFWITSGTTQQTFNDTDCFGIILRAAQICGLPFFFKSIKILINNLASFTRKDKLKPGDLILCSGHVFIVGSIDNNELIEACGYSSKSSKVNCVNLSQLFENIKSFDDFITAYFENRPIVLLDTKQSKTVAHFKILKMASIAKCVI